MKIQIRKGVFETNSSTNHTLTVRRKWDSAEIEAHEGETIILGKTPKETIDEIKCKSIVNLGELPLQTKADLMLYAALGNFDTAGFINSVAFLTDAIRAAGMNPVVEFSTIAEMAEQYWSSEGFYTVLDQLLDGCGDTKYDNAISFLFGKDAYYTAYCDECCERPTETMIEIEDRMYKLPENERIIIRERM